MTAEKCVWSELSPFQRLCNQFLHNSVCDTCWAEQAIYHDCVLILHKEWIEQGELFQNKVNCYAVGYTDTPEKEIAEIINQPLGDEYESILNTSKKLLKEHIQVQWD